MSKKSISVDVKAANSKLAKFLRQQEEEEAALGIAKRKPKKLQEEKKRLPGGRARWSMEPDFRIPTPMVDRPRTQTGATSFHFSYITISKQAVPTHQGRPVGHFGRAKEASLQHAKYIERDGAAETSRGAEHASYVERPGAVETILPTLDQTAPSRDAFDETPTSEEAALLGGGQARAQGIPSVFSNISDDPFERQEFWRAVERCEREPRVHEIILEPDVNPSWWQEISTSNTLDPAFKNHALTVAEAYRQWLQTPSSTVSEKKPFTAAPFKASAVHAGKIITQAQAMASFDFARPPFEFKSGRGGRVQFRMVAELPHELSAEDRALIVQNFCDHLGGLEKRVRSDGQIEKVGMMYTAVIHAPDSHNDRRNYHLHVVAYDRPARFLPDVGLWDFEVREPYVSHRKERMHYPYRQPKIGEIARANKGAKNHDKAGRNFIPALRQKFSQITNAVLEARGIERRYDPRRYTEMGIDRTPTEHLGTKAAALESIGVPTIVGQLNAIAIWSDAERQINNRAKNADAAYRRKQSEIEKIASSITGGDPEDPHLKTLRSLLVKRADLITSVADDRKSIMTFEHMEAKAKSRAVRTRQTCLQFLADIEAGRADRNTRIMKNVIQDRWKAATAHIAEIDHALAPHREALADAARDVEMRERRIAEIDKSLPSVIAQARRQNVIELISSMVKKNQPSPAQEPVPNVASDRPGRTTSAEAGQKIVPVNPVPGREDQARDSVPRTAGKTQPPSEPLKPISIEGFPIAKPTIAPEVRPDRDAPSRTPEGLTPLRPSPNSAEPGARSPASHQSASQMPAQATGEPIPLPARSNQQDEGRAPVRPVEETGKAQESKQAPAPEPKASPDFPTPFETEPQPDRRKKKEDPKLFDTPEQLAPVKPGTAHAEYERWSRLLDRIARERIPVQVVNGKAGNPIYKVPSLGAEEQQLLQTRRMHARTIKRLSGIAETQRLEIDKALRWISKHGQNPSVLIFEPGGVRLDNVTQAVLTIFGHWGNHPEVTAAFKAEYERRRLEAIKQAQIVAPETPERNHAPQPQLDAEIAEEKAHAETVYPEPKHVYTPEVKEFTRLLRELAPEPQLRAAADKIINSIDAREDVQRHTPELAVAFSRYSDGYHERFLAMQITNQLRQRGR